MRRALYVVLISILGLVACDVPPPATPTTGAQTGSGVYRIAPEDAERVQLRLRDGMNAIRTSNGLAPLELDARLASAAATHAQDMSFQARPWHWGSDGSSPMVRVRRAGYGGMLVGELISETFENEVQTLSAWMRERETRDVIMDPRARQLGVGWYQEDNGKLWWVAVMGHPSAEPVFDLSMAF